MAGQCAKSLKNMASQIESLFLFLFERPETSTADTDEPEIEVLLGWWLSSVGCMCLVLIKLKSILKGNAFKSRGLKSPQCKREVKTKIISNLPHLLHP